MSVGFLVYMVGASSVYQVGMVHVGGQDVGVVLEDLHRNKTAREPLITKLGVRVAYQSLAACRD